MPDSYDNLFGPDPLSEPSAQSRMQSLADVPEQLPAPEPLDDILLKIRQFDEQAKSFSVLLSQTRAVDHEVQSPMLRLFVAFDDPHDQHTLAGEKAYHDALRRKFRHIAAPMKELAALHLDTVRRFNEDIDEQYFSVEKEQAQVNADREAAMEGIQLQRWILADAAATLDLLTDALDACETRLKTYVDAGGVNNLSASEFAMIRRSRLALTSGGEHAFNHTFFNMNLLDKAALALGIHQKETSAQYLQRLLHAWDNRQK